MNLETIGDQGQRKYDEDLINQVNQEIEAEARREEIEKRRAELQAKQQERRNNEYFSKLNWEHIPKIIPIESTKMGPLYRYENKYNKIGDIITKIGNKIVE